MGSVKDIAIVLVSPGDLEKERIIVQKAIARLGKVFEARGVRLAVRKWEDLPSSYATAGSQKYVQAQLDIPASQLVIALFWKRYGQIDDPPNKYSRTASEVLSAMESKRENGSPEVMAYFSRRRYSPTLEDLREHIRVLEFKQELRDAGVLTKDFEPPKFQEMLEGDLLVWLEQNALPPQPYENFSCVMACVPADARGEGFTEAIGEIQIAFKGTVPASSALIDIRVTLSTNVTNRFNADGTVDASVQSDSRPFAIRGRTNPTGLGPNNVLLFSQIPLGPPGSTVNDVLRIKGIRCDAEIFSVSRTFAQVIISASVEILASGVTTPAIATGWLSVGQVHYVSRSNVTARSTSDTGTSGLPVSPEVELRLLEVHIEESFVGAFQARQQDAGNTSNERGTILAMFATGLPSGSVIFATSTNITPVGDSAASWSAGCLVALRTAPDGLPICEMSTSEESTWESGIQMFRVEEYLAAWEVIQRPEPKRLIVTIGLALLIPRDAMPVAIEIACGFAPFYTTVAARLPSMSLPVPRFLPSGFIRTVALD